MRKMLLALPLALSLVACGFTSSGDFVRGAIADYGSQAMDEGLINAEFFVCRAASAGSVIRRNGKSAETAEAWKTLCQGDAEVDIIEAPPTTEPAT